MSVAMASSIVFSIFRIFLFPDSAHHSAERAQGFSAGLSTVYATVPSLPDRALKRNMSGFS